MRYLSTVGLAALTFLSGCGAAFTSGPSGSGPTEDCTKSFAAPVIDTLLATVLTTLAAVALATGVSEQCSDTEFASVCLKDAKIFGGAAAGFLALPAWASAGVGYWRVLKCREARARTVDSPAYLRPIPIPTPSRPD